MQLSFILHGDRPLDASWRFLWAKHVVGFDPAKHCARCLQGRYDNRFGRAAQMNAPIEMTGYAAGDLLYFCGVAKPARWVRNLHLAVLVTGDPQDISSAVTWDGGELTVTGARAIVFDDREVLAGYADLGPAFTTCRNFHFGVDMVKRGLLNPGGFVCA